ncbi:unnamed protein product [Mesocestoides corti]|uniref:Uncharacterized protein n=1 Tax=Mesocestoides corti TaxID=53468 RepID=A0A0R3UJI2_MESCO|nr:unnamed protein product [Mesocestoides corti]
MQIAFPVAAMNSSIAMAQAEESPSHRTAPPAATRRAPSAAPVASHANHLCLSVWVCLFRWVSSGSSCGGATPMRCTGMLKDVGTAVCPSSQPTHTFVIPLSLVHALSKTQQAPTRASLAPRRRPDNRAAAAAAATAAGAAAAGSCDVWCRTV